MFSKQKKQLSKIIPHGFTLTELVVVMTILAILGTIGFIAVKGYSSNARDSERSTDIASITRMLDVSIVTVGNYPMPDNSFTVTYSGGVVWYQGTLSNGAIQQLHTSISGGGLTKKPVDPLSGTEYSYSSLAFGKAYQIKGNYEGDVVGMDIVPTAYALPGNPDTAYIKGNYGGLAAKTQSGSTVCILAIPSIVTSTGSVGSTLELTANTLSWTLLFNGKSTKVRASAYNPNAPVFCGPSIPTDDKSGQISAIVTALKAAYSGSDISSVSQVSSLLTTPANQVSNLGSTIVSSQLGVKISQDGGSGTSSCNPGYGLSGTGICIDNVVPTITSVTASTPACNTVRLTVNGAADIVGLHALPYSFDNGSTWQLLSYKDYSTTSYTASANQIRVRDLNGNIYQHVTAVNGTASSCPVNGICNNGIPLGCSAGFAISDSGQTSCGATRTWYCSGTGGGSTSGQCSYYNGACCAANMGQSCSYATSCASYGYTYGGMQVHCTQNGGSVADNCGDICAAWTSSWIPSGSCPGSCSCYEPNQCNSWNYAGGTIQCNGSCS